MNSDLCLASRCHCRNPRIPHMDYCLRHAQVYCLTSGCHSLRLSSGCILCADCHTTGCCSGCSLLLPNNHVDQHQDTAPGSDFVCDACDRRFTGEDRAHSNEDICTECWEEDEETEDEDDAAMNEEKEEEKEECVDCRDCVFHLCTC